MHTDQTVIPSLLLQAVACRERVGDGVVVGCGRRDFGARAAAWPSFRAVLRILQKVLRLM